jgi:hypothetical protein
MSNFKQKNVQRPMLHGIGIQTKNLAENYMYFNLY